MKQQTGWRAFALAMFLALAMLLAACAAGGRDLPPKPEQEEGVLVYASLNPDGVDREAVDEFNRTHADIQIEVRDYTGSSENGGRRGKELLLTEIAAGQIPDIIDLGTSWGGAGQLPYRMLAEKGYLEDLWPYIENDPELGRGSVLEAPLRAAEVDGGLYMVFGDVTVNTLIGAESVVGDRYSWSFQELIESFSAMPEGSTILEYCYTKTDMFTYMLSMSLENYVDWETGRCFFDGEGFRSALKFIHENFPSEFDWWANRGAAEEIAHRRQAGQQMLSLSILSGPHDIRVFDAVWGGRASFIGYPTEDGSVGSSFSLSNRKLAMSSTCRNKAAAWDFIRQILLPQYDAKMKAGEPVNIPVNKADYGRANADQRKEREVSVFGYGSIVKVPAVQKEDVERFESFLNSIEKISVCDSTIYSIVYEQCGPYFAGAKTLDETVALLQNRVGLYVNENR